MNPEQHKYKIRTYEKERVARSEVENRDAVETPSLPDTFSESRVRDDMETST